MYIIGHERERTRLREKFTRGQLGQTYFFHGPRGIGKNLCALEFAAHLAGEADFTPTAGLPHPADVMIIRPEEETKKNITKQKPISAATVRVALRFLSLYPARGRYRVLIIEDAELLTLSAGNALLKTLEEPNPTSVLILVAGEKGRLLPTLLSRTEKVRFSFVPLPVMREAFQKDFYQENDQALLSFFLSLGRPGLMVRAKVDPVFFAETREKLEKLFRLSSLSTRERLGLAESLGGDIPAATRLLEWWLPGLHGLALKKIETSGRSQLFRYLEEVERTIFLLRTTQANARLLLEKLFFSLP